VKPVRAFMEAGDTLDLEIARDEGPKREDKLVILFKQAQPDDIDPRKTYANGGTPEKTSIALIVLS